MKNNKTRDLMHRLRKVTAGKHWDDFFAFTWAWEHFQRVPIGGTGRGMWTDEKKSFVSQYRRRWVYLWKNGFFNY